MTRDADLAVIVAGNADAEALVRTLQERGWRVVTAIEQEAARRLATVRLAVAGEDVQAADPIDVVPGFRVPIARLGHLIALKILARDDRTRPQDRVDLGALLARADSAAMHEARAALTLVTDRGFQRVAISSPPCRRP